VLPLYEDVAGFRWLTLPCVFILETSSLPGNAERCCWVVGDELLSIDPVAVRCRVLSDRFLCVGEGLVRVCCRVLLLSRKVDAVPSDNDRDVLVAVRVGDVSSLPRRAAFVLSIDSRLSCRVLLASSRCLPLVLELLLMYLLSSLVRPLRL